MSSYGYTPPSSPTFGFFPTGSTSPNAFAMFAPHQSPRDAHNMYAAFAASAAGHHHAPSSPQPSQGGGGGLKNFLLRKFDFELGLGSRTGSVVYDSRQSPSLNPSHPPPQMVSRPPPTAPQPTAHSSLNTAYSLALLSEYTHTLDSLPLDLSRSFADLRELDAVLSSSMITITAKIHHLTSMVEEHRGTKEERLWLLHEIAEEAARLKYGGDDKIRVACQAADTLKTHSAHLRTLAERLPDFDAAVLNRKTAYPHVSAKSFMPLNMDTGRRRRGGAGSSGLLVASAVDPSPAKRKRFAREEEIDIGGVRSPHKKERTLEPPNPRARTNGRMKKNERVPSPSESLVSVTSHLPSQNTHHTNGTSATARGASSHQQHHTSSLSASANNRSTNGTTTNKRRGGNNVTANSTTNNNSNNNRVSTTPLPNDYPPQHNPASSVQSHRAGSGGSTIPSSSSNHHPPSSNIIMPFRNGPVVANGSGGGAHPYDLPHSMSGTPDWNPPPAQQLEGPGMPIARSTSIHSTITNANGTAGSGGRNGNSTAVNSGGTDGGTTEAGDADGDNDDGRTYCFCDSFSYGEMIACDDENCEREWFHLSCIGLTVCPEGSWFCDTCKNKRNAKRSGRGGKRRAAGNRAGGKA